jgi:hypothetical protein
VFLLSKLFQGVSVGYGIQKINGADDSDFRDTVLQGKNISVTRNKKIRFGLSRQLDENRIGCIPQPLYGSTAPPKLAGFQKGEYISQYFLDFILCQLKLGVRKHPDKFTCRFLTGQRDNPACPPVFPEW